MVATVILCRGERMMLLSPPQIPSRVIAFHSRLLSLYGNPEGFLPENKLLFPSRRF